MTGLRIEYEPPLARVTLDRPDRRNAVSGEMWLRLPELAREIEAREDVRVVLMQGAGSEAFSAGADIAELQALLAEPTRMLMFQRAVQDAQEAWWRLERPTIALIRGACTGGGCGLAVACDLRIATPDSFFSLPPAKLGLVYSLADTLRVVDVIGTARAKEMLFSGRRVSAQEALSWGLVNRVVAREQLDAEAGALAQELAASLPMSVRAMKRIVNAISRGARTETEESQRLYSEGFRSAEFRAAVNAFLKE
jgi:enoyl-CoA hydratase/carnithine racemase